MRTAATDRRCVGAALAALAVVLPGCGSPPPYPPEMPFPPREDRLVLAVPTKEPAGVGEQGKLDDEIAKLDALGGKTADPAAVPAEQRAALNATLGELFGTPAAPIAALDGTAVEGLGLTPERLAQGGQLFRRHCLHCHGLSGDGRGPTGPWIHPHPRDFRRGSFKFVSTGDGGKPRRSDLHRTIREGMKGTAMPPFAMLPEDQRDLLAGYVTFLSLRGQTEYRTLAALLTGEEGAEDDVPGYARAQAAKALGEWAKAEAAPAGTPAPAESAAGAPEHLASIRRGYELFTAAGSSSCISCHRDFGRQDTFRYDVWGTVVRPADLTASARKGGDRPEELYQRIRHGIQPSGMPAHPHLTDAQVWDLVRFVRALPQPADLPDDVRAKVYPKP